MKVLWFDLEWTCQLLKRPRASPRERAEVAITQKRNVRTERVTARLCRISQRGGFQIHLLPPFAYILHLELHCLPPSAFGVIRLAFQMRAHTAD